MRRLIALLACAGIMTGITLTATVAQASTVSATPSISLTKSTVTLVCEGGLAFNPTVVKVHFPGVHGTTITKFGVFADSTETAVSPKASIGSSTMVSLKSPVFGVPSKFWLEAFHGWKYLASTQIVKCSKPQPTPPPCRYLPGHRAAVCCEPWTCLPLP